MFGNIGGTVSQNCKFGLPTLDEILGGGIPRGQTWLIEDQIGTDYEPLVTAFLANGLQTMDYVYFLSTDNVFNYYKLKFQNFGVNPTTHLSTGRIKFIDGFTGNYQVGLNIDNTPGGMTTGYADFGAGLNPMMDINEGIETLTDITQPRELNEAVRRSLLHVNEGTGTGIRGVVISLSTIIHAATSMKDVFSFIQNRRAMDSIKKSTTLLTIHADAHDQTLARAIEHQVDGVLRVTPVQDPDNPDEILQMVEVIHARGKAELTGKQVVFRFSSGRIIPA